MQYLKRYVEAEIEFKMGVAGVVVVLGPKFCGKTTTAKLFAHSLFSLDEKEKIEMAQSDPHMVLSGETPRLVDEWQMAPNLWNVARSEVDSRNDKFGQYIFTGS